MQNTKKGFGTIVMVVIVAVLAIIAYGIFKKTTLAPEETPNTEIETTEIPQVENKTYQTPTTKTQVTTGVTTPEVTEITQEDIQAIESETSLLQTEFDDFMFEDLGLE